VGKKTFWKALSLCPQAVNALIKLGNGDVETANPDLKSFILTAYSP
jgi:hypothetical protein